MPKTNKQGRVFVPSPSGLPKRDITEMFVEDEGYADDPEIDTLLRQVGNGYCPRIDL